MARLEDHPALEALTLWWEGAGLAVDRRDLARQLVALEKGREQEAYADQSKARSYQPAAPAKVVPEKADPAQESRKVAESVDTIDALRSAVMAFDGCALKEKAKNTVFADGNLQAEIMVIGEGPGREEDEQGRPFVGKSGQLLDKMLAAIGVRRSENAVITNVNYWRPPGNRNPTEEELAICRPFLDRHIALTKPRIIIAVGAVPAQALMGTSVGITRLRGKVQTLEVPGLNAPVPLVPIFHPAYLLRRPPEKAKAWTDLLTIKAHLLDMGVQLGDHV